MRRAKDRKRRAKAGVTLVEVMLAGAMTALVTLATLEGFIVTAKIAHENAESLRKDGEAFDQIWMEFNHDFESLKLGDVTLSNATSSVSGTLSVSRPPDQDPNLRVISYRHDIFRNQRTLIIYRSNIPRLSKDNVN